MKKAGIALACVGLVIVSATAGFAGGYAAFCRWGNAVDAQETIPTTSPPLHSEYHGISSVNTVADAVRICAPSLVEILVEQKVNSYNGGSSSEYSAQGAGTGVVFSTDGYIVTCLHVVDGAEKISVTLFDGSEYSAELRGKDDRFDLAVLKIECDVSLQPARLGNSDTQVAGQYVVVIGNPLGEFGSSVSAGVLSSLAREVTIEDMPLILMQTDAAVNPGNSGGGMFNLDGELIGIVNAKITHSSVEGIGFAIPINNIREKVQSIIQDGTTSGKAYLGLATRQSAFYDYNHKKVECLHIVSVTEGGPSDKAHIKAGDYLVAIDQKTVTDNDDVTLAINMRAPGDTVVLKLWSDGKYIEKTVILGNADS